MHEDFAAMSAQDYGQLGAAMYTANTSTIKANIDQQIEFHQAAIARLAQTRAKFGAAGLLEMNVNELREAMCL